MESTQVDAVGTEIRPFEVDVPQADFDEFRRRIQATPAEPGGARLPQPHLLQRSRQGRPLRRLGAAAALHRGNPRGIPITTSGRRSS